MDLVSHHYSIITAVESLPYDCLSLFPCSTSFGGVMIFTSNSIVYVDQSSRRVVLPLNGWSTRVSDMPLPSVTPEERLRNIDLQGSRSSFVDDRSIFVILRDGTVYPVEFVVDGKTVSKLVIAPALARATIPSVVTKINDDLLFIGSTVGPSVLLRTARVEEEVQDDHTADNAPAAVVDVASSMEIDDDDGEPRPCIRRCMLTQTSGRSLRGLRIADATNGERFSQG
jgi:cleavage and polyadenylation specificity factor subunit 1